VSQNVVLTVTGASEIHLSGFFEPQSADGDDNMFMDEEEEDEEEEEEEETGVKLN